MQSPLQSNLKHFLPLKKALPPLSRHSFSPTTTLLSASVVLPFLNISYKWNHNKRPCLASDSWYVCEARFCCSTHSTSSLSMADQYSMFCIYYNLFTNRSVMDSWSFSHLLVFVNSAAMNIHVQVFA